jgi:hypothetical protein
MTRTTTTVALIAAVAAVAIIAGPLLNADRHEQVSLSAILAWPTFARTTHGSKQ